MRWPRSSCAPAFRRACSIWSSGGARWSVRRSSTTSGLTRSPSPARSRPAAGSPPPAPARCAGFSSKWAARIRSLCSRTPICRRRSNARSTAPISRPASAARPRRGSSSRSRSTGAFADALIERMRGLVVDDALKPGTHIGPVVDATQLEQDLSYVAIGQKEGAKLALGGERLNRATPGFYMAPALFLDADNSMRISREEIFGPVSAMIPARDYDHALGDRERYRIWLVRRHLHDEPQARLAFQAQRRSRHGDGQSADGGRRLSTRRSAAAKAPTSGRASRGAMRSNSTRR